MVKDTSRRFGVVTIAVLALLWTAIAFLPRGPRIGDGSNYLAMLVTLGKSGHPWMDAQDEELWSSLVEKYPDDHYATVDIFKQRLHKLTNQNGIHMPHFWFYPLLALPFYPAAKMAGTSPAYAFNILHAFLLVAGILVVRKQHDVPGIIAFLLLIFASPVLFFINKVHTEYYTVIISCMAVSLFWKKKYLWAMIPFAMATTQNPPFVIPAFLCGLFWIYETLRAHGAKQGLPRLLGVRNLTLIAIAVILVFLHPAYYYLQLGGMTPQVITGHAKAHLNISRIDLLNRMACWIMDPDIGLLPNWLGAIPIIVAFATLAICRSYRKNWPLIILFTISASIFAFAHSRTNTVPHGGTVDIARYSLWYLCFFYPPLVLIVTEVLKSSAKPKIVSATLAIALLAANSNRYHPFQRERYLHSTPVANFVYAHVPWLYNPVPVIFAKRSICNKKVPPVWAIANPEATKILIRQKYMDGLTPKTAPMPINAPKTFDSERLFKYANAYFYISKADHVYINNGLEYRLEPKYEVGQTIQFNDRSASPLLGEGWSKPEKFGYWSDSPEAVINFTLTGEAPQGVCELTLGWRAYAPDADHSQKIAVSLNGVAIGENTFSGMKTETASMKLDAKILKPKNRLAFTMSNPQSPRDLGYGKDPRPLGVGIVTMKISICETKTKALP